MEAFNFKKSKTGSVTIEVDKKLSKSDAQALLEKATNAAIREVCFAIPASLATDFMLVQLAFALRRNGSSISIVWSDHEPSQPVYSIVQSLMNQ